MCESTRKLREIILNTKKPLVLRNFKYNWPPFQNGLRDWCYRLDKYQKEPLHFECMLKSNTNTPQWERKRKMIQLEGKEFFHEVTKIEPNEHWLGLNYKRVHELPNECTEGIDFSVFGFPNAHKDSTIWLSSTGANTPCHYDSYGCNIVVQVYGKKLWLLYPPEAKLTTSRIPYEESSIYCLENFYAPNSKDIENLKKLSQECYSVELEENDVLIVPHHWWHYVETMETSLSVNTWIPLHLDVENQIDECIVQYLMGCVIKSMETPPSNYVLNPNQVNNIGDSCILFNILALLLKKLGNDNFSGTKLEQSYYLNEMQLQDLLKNCEVPVTPILVSPERVQLILERNSSRCHLDKDDESTSISPLNPLEECLIQSICHPKIVRNIREEFIKQYESKYKTMCSSNP